MNTEANAKPTIEELLNPRYKLIADYPGCSFEVGTILEPNHEGELFSKTAGYSWTVTRIMMQDAKKFSHLIKILAWWEHREESEMPEYVKPKNPEEYRKQFGEVVLEVDKRTSGLHQFHATNLFQLASMQWSNWLPATHEEYLSYLNSQPKP
jgi:hypothetical protein